MKILAIETSCDDTGIAVLEVSKDKDFKVFSNIVASQIEVHKKYGGVFPMLAKREHQKNLVPTLKLALKEANLLKITKSKFQISNKIQNSKFQILNSVLERELDLYKKIIPFLKKYGKPDVDLISVTNGPGLEPCLWVGVNFAKALSYFWNIPIVPVNHIESHILVNLLSRINKNPKSKIQNPKIDFPTVCLVVSGGHTQIILMKKIGKYKILGETRDDAAGECFDKCAKILGLGYPGGPIISKLAEKAPRRPTSGQLQLPRPMIGTKDYDFSFSGLKTAVLYKWQEIDKKDLSRSERKRILREMATEIQQAIIDVLIKKTMKAAKDYKAKIPMAKPSRTHDTDFIEHSRRNRNKIGAIILGGGVSANSELRKQFQSAVNRHCEESQRRSNLKLILPKPDLSTDNAVMTAITGFYHKKNTKDWKNIKADANLRIHPVK